MGCEFPVKICDFPHTCGQAGVVLALHLCVNRSKLIANRTGLSTRAVQHTLARLWHLGFLEKRLIDSGSGRYCVWTVRYPDLWELLLLPIAREVLRQRLPATMTTTNRTDITGATTMTKDRRLLTVVVGAKNRCEQLGREGPGRGPPVELSPPPPESRPRGGRKGGCDG